MDGPDKNPESAPLKKTSYRHKARLPFPFARIAPFLMATKHAKYAKRVGAGAPRYLAAVVEYLTK